MPNSEDFLFELYTEEIPAFYQKKAIEEWGRRLPAFLKENRFSHGKIVTGGTSKRIFVQIEALAMTQEKTVELLKGPPEEICYRDGNPLRPLTGFAAKAGVEIGDLKVQEIDSKRYVTAEVTRGGGSFIDIIPNFFQQMVEKYSFPKRMRWGAGKMTYARPVIQYFCLSGQRKIVLNGEFWSQLKNGEGLVLGTKILDLKSPLDYQSILLKNRVVAEVDQRRETIVKQLKQTAGDNLLVENETLLDEVNFLVETPMVVAGEFPEEFLELPEVVILSEMEMHQRYFGLKDRSGKLIPRFLIVTNADTTESETAANVITGNEKVLNARLSDGRFFFNEDRKLALADRVEDLKKIVFQENFGTMYEKMERLQKLSVIIDSFFPVPSPEKALQRAALLVKADLTTQMVYEFDHLQGEIGEIYAIRDGEDKAVATAIREHYLPRGQDDLYPETQVGAVLSIADKLDNIIAGFYLNKQPTSSHDPLALRRQTLYLIEIVIRNKLTLPLRTLWENVSSVYSLNGDSKKDLFDQIFQFVLTRLETIFDKEGFDKKLIRSAVTTGSDDLYSLYLKLSSLRSLKQDENFQNLLGAFKRMNNIIRDFESKGAGVVLSGQVAEERLQLEEEKGLYQVGVKTGEMIGSSSALSEEDYRKVFTYISDSKKIVDLFFEKVMVNADDESIRINRLNLLKGIVTQVKKLLNIEELQ